MRTVNDVLHAAEEIFFGSIERYGVKAHSPAQWAFKEKLFAISKERRTKTPDQTIDVDASALLTDEEFDQLVIEARGLPSDF